MGEPFDYSLMNYYWEGHYFVDLAVAMGMRAAPSCCQRVTSAIRYIHEKSGFWLMNYIDDFIGAECWSWVWASYEKLGDLLNTLGAKEAHNKASPPDTVVNCLGTLVNTLNMTISVIPERLVELLKLLETWHFKVMANKRELQQLIGKLQFVTSCLRQGRVFICRLLNWFRNMKQQKWYRILTEARNDIKWWYIYLPQYNGVLVMWYNQVDLDQELMAKDSCLNGCGGWLG